MTYEEMDQRGIDYDLQACLEENPQEGFTLDDIANVLAVVEGENEERDWYWILRLSENTFALLAGGCGYTGWDCQSWTVITFVKAEDVLELDAAIEEFFSGEEDIDSLKYQIRHGRNTTWRTQMDAEFGVESHQGEKQVEIIKQLDANPVIPSGNAEADILTEDEV